MSASLNTNTDLNGKAPGRFRSLLNSSILQSVDRMSFLLNSNQKKTKFKMKKKKQKNKYENNNLVVASPLLRPPQSIKGGSGGGGGGGTTKISVIQQQIVKEDEATSSSSSAPLSSLLSTNKQNQIIHSETTATGESNGSNNSSNNLKLYPSSSSRRLQSQKSISGCNIKQYDKRAQQIFPSVFNLICGSFDALIQDNVVLEEHNTGKKMGEFTSTLLKILYDAHEDGSIEDMSWELLLKFLREQLLIDGYHQVPQLLSSRLLDVKTPVTMVNDLYGGFGTRRAVLVGINYTGYKGELKGCHDDVKQMKKYLIDKQDFDENDITVLLDDGVHTIPTKANIIEAYRRVAKDSAPGDTIFIHYSGHGGHVVDESGDEEDGYDETIIPIDFETAGEILDDDLCDEFVKRIPKGVLVTALMDPHNGGTVLDMPYYFTGEAMKRSYDPFDSYPAEFIMISGCHDAQESVCTDPKKFLPNPLGRKSGAFTAALLKTLYEAHEDDKLDSTSWVNLLKILRSHLCDKGFNQVPQLSSTRLFDVNKPLRIINSKKGTRRAVLIGINYVGQKNALPGCHNDVRNMLEYLKTKQGFKDRNIMILMDDGEHTIPTYANIMNAYKRIVQQSQPGDSVFLHFSGHGAQILDKSGDEDDGFDETLIPVDFQTSGHIVDDTLCDEIVKKMPKGVLVTALMDCCHSGTVLDLPYYFNGEGGVDAMERLNQFAFVDIQPVRSRICCFPR